MFLAPAGNPSSLRVGHPDVATEHTCLSPAIPLSPGRWSSWCGCAAGVRTAGYSAWEECARIGGRGTRVRYRRQLAGRRRLVAGYGGGSVWEVSAPSRELGARRFQHDHASAQHSYTFLKRHQGARALRGRVPLQERRKCIAGQAHTPQNA